MLPTLPGSRAKLASGCTFDGLTVGVSDMEGNFRRDLLTPCGGGEGTRRGGDFI